MVSRNRFNLIVGTSFNLSCVCGFDNVTVYDIEKAANVSAGAIYYHFESKDDILKEILKQYLCKEFKKFKNHLINIEGDLDLKLHFIFNYLTNNNILSNSPVLSDFDDFRDYYRFLFSSFHGHHEIREYIFVVLDDLEACFEETFITDLNPDDSNLIFSIVKSFILTINLSSDDFDIENCIKSHIKLIKMLL